MPPSPDRRPSALDRAARVAFDVRSGEAETALLFASALFVGLFSYYVLKTVREPLLLVTGGAEAKTYATAIQALALLAGVPLYGAIARRVPRRTLVLGAQLAFVASVELFAWLVPLRLPYLGLVFYVWLGVYALTSVAQLWSLANDTYAHSDGLRLFPVVALGAPLGSAAGALFAARVFAGSDALSSLLHAAALLLVVQLALFARLFRRPELAAPSEPLTGANGIALVLASPYLRSIALLVVVLNLVNTTGEFLLSHSVLAEARDAEAHHIASALAAGHPIVASAAFRETFVRTAYGELYFVVSCVSVLLQAFVASRWVRVVGIRGVLLALPLVAMGVYGLAALGVPFAVFRALKIAENATDYSVQNTGRALLWLPASRDEKYKAKQAIDATFLRLGDVLAAALVFVAVRVLALPPRALAVVDVALAGLAAVTALRIATHFEAQTQRVPSESAPHDDDTDTHARVASIPVDR